MKVNIKVKIFDFLYDVKLRKILILVIARKERENESKKCFKRVKRKRYIPENSHCLEVNCRHSYESYAFPKLVWSSASIVYHIIMEVFVSALLVKVLSLWFYIELERYCSQQLNKRHIQKDAPGITPSFDDRHKLMIKANYKFYLIFTCLPFFYFTFVCNLIQF
uniref:Uncharacterized protein n=1 Tax=Glossina palpalis gambiensis TaxID=67801 RepID=A0A1B0AKS0_9MUSC